MKIKQYYGGGIPTVHATMDIDEFGESRSSDDLYTLRIKDRERGKVANISLALSWRNGRLGVVMTTCGNEKDVWRRLAVRFPFDIDPREDEG